MSNSKLQPLQLLDLQQCQSVADLVQAMGQCSFGARMLGQVVAQLKVWITAGQPAIALYDGPLESALGQLLSRFVERRWLAGLSSSPAYVQQASYCEPLLVIGSYWAGLDPVLAQRHPPAIFINPYGMVPEGQVSDGYFPNVVFADPTFVLPVIFTTLDELLNGTPVTVTQFLEQLVPYGGTAAAVYDGAQTLLAMVQDPSCTVFLTLSGAMTIAKMGLVICDMIDHGMVQTVCSTGALMAHGLVESIGLGHFKYDPNLDDAELAALELNRVTDTLEPETNLNDVARKMALVLEHYIDDRQPLSPRLLHQQVGRYLTETYPQQRGILKSAYEQQVPVIVPAFHDSELGNDVCLYNTLRQRQGQDPLVFNQELDTRFLLNMATQSEKLGIFTIGGGVPRNYMQNLPPLVDILKGNQLVDWPDIRFAYGCRICPDPTYLGHLSGCTYSEGMSWRKMDINGQFSEIRADATQVWPFLIKYVLEAQE